MGALTTAHFYTVLVQKLNEKGFIQDSDFPETIILSIALKEWSEKGFVSKNGCRKQLIEAVQKLEAWGADFIAIPCNTVHEFFDDMQAAVKIPILNMVEETKAACAPYKHIAVLCSSSTRTSGLYSALNPAYPNQQDVVQAILEVMSGDIRGITLREAIFQVLSRVEAIVLGCTELSIPDLKRKNFTVKFIDSTEVLADAVVKQICN